jgi:predicted nicotinamide N-methyase
MSWFERRQQSNSEVTEKQEDGREVPEIDAAASEQSPDIHSSITVATLGPITYVPSGRSVVQISKHDGDFVTLELCGHQLSLDLRFDNEEIEPIFSGGVPTEPFTHRPTDSPTHQPPHSWLASVSQTLAHRMAPRSMLSHWPQAWAGSVIWHASMAMCDILAASCDPSNDLPSVRGKRLLELGAGVGLPGITAHLLGAGEARPDVCACTCRVCTTALHAAAAAAIVTWARLEGDRVWQSVSISPGLPQVLLTDQQPVDGLLARSAAASGPLAGMPAAGSVAAAALDWADSGACDGLVDPAWDYVVVADCVYEPLYGESWRLLVAVLDRCYAPAPSPLLS